jgi:tripartite-type tricarboxylate transporter receptor subunit TctC
MTMTKRFLVGAGVALAATLGGTMAGAQSYPTKNITVIIPFAGGSASDVVSRIMFDKMSKNMGQPIIVENRPGAGGNSGTGAAAKAAPDGYTLVGGGSGPVAANLALYKVLGYDPEKDLEMISPFAGFTIIVVASKNIPIHSLKELVEYAKANPGKLNYGSVGIGSSQHLAGEFFSQINGVKLTHVPYRNIAQYGPDLIAGQVPLGFQWYPNVAGPLGAKGAIPLAVAGDKRIAAQGERLVRAAGAGRHAEADPGAAQQGSEGGGGRPAGEKRLRDRRRRDDVDAARSGEEVAP